MNRKIVFLVLGMVLMTASAFASPFLVCDPYPTTAPQPTYFELVFDAGAPVQSPPEAISGGVRLHHDLSSMAVGNHNVTVKACNTWGCSSTVPFAFTKSVPINPAGIKLE